LAPSFLIILALTVLPAAAQTFDTRFASIVRDANKNELYALMWALPKGGDLHHHFVLSIPAEVWLAYATEPAHTRGNAFYTRVKFDSCPGDNEPLIRFRNIQQSTWQALSECRRGEYVPLASLGDQQRSEWLSSLKIDKPGEGRDEFFDVIVRRMGDMDKDPNVLGDAMAEALKQMAAQGVRYLETQVAPTTYLRQDGRLLSPDDGVEAVRAVLDRPDVKATGIQVRFLYAFLRFRPDSEKMLEFAYSFVDRHRDLWKGINLVGREDNEKGYALRFLETFRRMRRQYPDIHLSIHAGEKDSPGHEVRDTLLLGAERIGHGVNLITDSDTMILARTGKFLVEIQLISNKLLEYTPDLSTHPFPEYLRTGIPVCLNTDDSMAWDSNITDEYYTALTTFHLSWEEIVRLGRNSLTYSFAEPSLKTQLLASYDADVERFEKRMSGDWRAALHEVNARPSGYAVRTFGLK
jgi:adenosine deaminase CECR1